MTMSDLQISDDMKMENLNEIMRLLRKSNNQIIDIDESLENASDTARALVTEKVVIHNYAAFLYNNDLIAGRDDIFDTLKEFLKRDGIEEWLQNNDSQHLEEFEDNHL